MQNCIKISDYNGNKVVDSYDLYVRSGLNPKNYYRWIDRYTSLAFKGVDYFEDPELLKVNKKVKKRYWISVVAACGLCIDIATRKSIDLRKFLIHYL